MRVNRPSPTSSTPVASGSRVPAWPTRRCEKIRRQRATTSWEVHPASLSTTTIPVVSGAVVSASRLPAIVTPRGFAQIAKNLFDPQAVGDSRIRLELEQGCALHPDLSSDGPLQLAALLGES